MNQQPDMFDVNFIRGFVRRRKKVFLAVSSAVFVVSVIVALLAPNAYVATATILIEGHLKEDIVKGVPSSYVEERLQVITQQLLSRDKLLEIIKQFNLFPGADEKADIESITKKMKDNIIIKTIKAEDLDKRPSMAGYSTVAFTLSYRGSDPETVQKVTSRLVSLYVEKNAQTKEQIVSQTTAVLQERLVHLKEQTEATGQRLSDFKRQHAGELPESMSFNLAQANRLNTQLEEVNAKIRVLEDKGTGSDGSTSSVDSSRGLAANNQATSDPWARLGQLKMQLINLRSRYSDKHPDVVKTKSEIQQLENRLGISSEQKDRQKRLEDLKTRREDLVKTLGPEHPDAVAATKEIDALSKEMENSKEKTAAVNTRDTELKKYLRQRDEIQRKINEYGRKSQMAPMLQSEYSRLVADHDNAMKQYNDVSAKLSEVKAMKKIEETQLGERFTVVDEPIVPQSPEKPKQAKTILVGFFLSLMSGLFAAVLMESNDHSVKSVEQLKRITKLPVLTVMPMMKPDVDDADQAQESPVMKAIEMVKHKVSDVTALVKGTKHS